MTGILEEFERLARSEADGICASQDEIRDFYRWRHDRHRGRVFDSVTGAVSIGASRAVTYQVSS